jgi:hypothetical protein
MSIERSRVANGRTVAILRGGAAAAVGDFR